MADEKRLERLLKKAKPFLDDKIKPKQRINALYAFTGINTLFSFYFSLFL